MISQFEQIILDITDKLKCSKEEKQDIILELRDHLYSSYEAYIEQGVNDDEAKQLVLKQFGASELISVQFQQTVNPQNKKLKVLVLFLFIIYSAVLFYELIFIRLFLRTIYYFQATDKYYHHYVKSALLGTSPKQFFNFSRWQMDINFIPFDSIIFYLTTNRVSTNIILDNLLINIVVFIPLGFFLPFLFTKMHNFTLLLFTAFGVGFLIEALQFALQVGIADIDDVILNIIGTSLGYLMYTLILKVKILIRNQRFKSEKKKGNNEL